MLTNGRLFPRMESNWRLHHSKDYSLEFGTKGQYRVADLSAFIMGWEWRAQRKHCTRDTLRMVTCMDEDEYSTTTMKAMWVSGELARRTAEAPTLTPVGTSIGATTWPTGSTGRVRLCVWAATTTRASSSAPPCKA